MKTASGLPDPAFASLARQAVAGRLNELRGELEELGKNSRSADAVHRVRVAGRRLRVALRGLSEALPPKKAKRWTSDVRKLVVALGRVRDADVQLDFLDAYLAENTTNPAPKWLPGVRRLRLRLDQQRHRQADRIARAVARFAESDMHRHLPAGDVSPQTETISSPTDPSMRRRAAGAIARRAAKLRAFSQFVDQPDNVEQLHRMRIAAKRLRYTLELYEPVLKDKQRRALVRIRKLQELLGDLHDCDMWIAHLPAFIDNERQRMLEYQGHLRGFARLAAGIEHLLADRRAARAVHYQAFVGYWRRLEKNKVLKKLAAPPQPPEVPPPPPEVVPTDAPTPSSPADSSPISTDPSQ